ncbi:lipopolysaccharide biosynthesis protein [Cumulibacter manganitolerans]|uniref:lipopolysaccharide biosynthesis protein n=1 Tax=Cumulibacter manganitolerans TaxID=1884992 RepID=UPI0012956A53|nr:hypothetical protein [Cumulibacter manganitolerans]
MSPRAPSAATWRALVPVATIISNVLSYVLFLAAARLLDRATYGETLSLLNLVVIATIPSFAMQTVVARRAATDSVGPRLLRVSAAIGVGGAAVIVLGAPLAVEFLHLPGYLGVLGGALCVPPLVMLGVAQGVAQGRRQWRALCSAVLLMGLGRVAGGVVGLIVSPTSSAALLGSAAGLVIAAAMTVRPALRSLHASPVDQGQTVRGLLWETAHAAHAHGVFLVLSSLDLTIARNLLTADQAGWYAAGNVVFRAALWLPQPVATLLFPALSDHLRHRIAARHGLLAVGGLVAGTIGGCAVFGGLIATIVGGSKFPDLGPALWLFAVAGGALALTQFCIYAGLAVLRRGRLALVWACIAAEVVAAYVLDLTTTPHRLIVTVSVIVASTAVVGMAITLTTRPAPREPGRAAVVGQIGPRTIEPL